MPSSPTSPSGFFTADRDEMGWLRHLHGVGLSQAAAMGVDVPGCNRFREAGILAFEIPDEARRFVRHARFRADPPFEPPGTSTGLIEIHARAIERMGHAGCPPHPPWLPPDEWSGTAGAHPLHVAASHPNSRRHAQRNGTVLREGFAVAGGRPVSSTPTTPPRGASRTAMWGGCSTTAARPSPGRR